MSGFLKKILILLKVWCFVFQDTFGVRTMGLLLLHMWENVTVIFRSFLFVLYDCGSDFSKANQIKSFIHCQLLLQKTLFFHEFSFSSTKEKYMKSHSF